MFEYQTNLFQVTGSFHLQKKFWIKYRFEISPGEPWIFIFSEWVIVCAKILTHTEILTMIRVVATVFVHRTTALNGFVIPTATWHTISTPGKLADTRHVLGKLTPGENIFLACLPAISSLTVCVALALRSLVLILLFADLGLLLYTALLSTVSTCQASTFHNNHRSNRLDRHKMISGLHFTNFRLDCRLHCLCVICLRMNCGESWTDLMLCQSLPFHYYGCLEQVAGVWGEG